MVQPRRVDCVGALVHDDRGRLLLVKRGREPALGAWSIPGGRVEPGETDHEATVREVREETGLEVSPERLVGVVERPGPDGEVFVIRDYACALAPEADAATARAASDAADLSWCPVDRVASLDCPPGLVEALREWGVLP